MEIVRARNNKKLLFACFGFFGGVIGSLIAESIEIIKIDYVQNSDKLQASFSLASVSICFLLAFFWAETIHNRKIKLTGKQIKQALVFGIIAGVVSGTIAQTLFEYASLFLPDKIMYFIGHHFIWAIFGALLGWCLVQIIPNLEKVMAVVAGAVSGVFGSFGFIIICTIISGGMPARTIGTGILGVALGLTIVLTEQLFREGSLQITWAQNEITTMNLCTRPIFIGGGDDHIFINGLPQNSASVVLKDGKVIYKDTKTAKETTLRNGSQLKMGKVEIIVHVK